MSKAAAISTRIDLDLKRDAEQVFAELGVTPSQAISMFYRQVVLQHGLPFEVKVPRKETQQALTDAQTRRDLEDFADLDALYQDLGI
ncbi:MAG: type II toxin-antitoxin system RelB/DinJ family antitoxin [Anaerolineae bacterium]|jgi:DNA-damage-inducible protein J|nr:type II toxin-antitoxin system RelB/DinJ family antitoxin [Anaerolineae bacterium]